MIEAEWLAKMGERPLILALANPTPEILPEQARAVRGDAIIATGRTDYPNQVNNVLCFPFLFRGALDCGATEINEAMKRACVEAIAELARAQSPDIVRRAYGGSSLRFGPDYLIQKPFDPRLMEQVAPAVAQAAMESGVAARPIADLDAYRQSLHHRVFRSAMTMKPVFDQARVEPRRVVFPRSHAPAWECVAGAPAPSSAARRWSVCPCSHAGAWEPECLGTPQMVSSQNPAASPRSNEGIPCRCLASR